MLILFPSDVTTSFLKVVVDSLKEEIGVDVDSPEILTSSLDDCYELIKKTDSSRLILFLGHGSAESLKAGNDVDLVTIYESYGLFNGKKLVLLSCFSSEFLQGLKDEFHVGIGFGNIPSSKAELSPGDMVKYQHDEFACIRLFNERLLKLFIQTLIESYRNNSNFIQLFHSLRLRINKIICNCSLSDDPTERLVGYLMFDLKEGMKVHGKPYSNVKSDIK